MDEPIATKHAYKRAKERLGWKKPVLDKMMIKALEEGLTHSQSKSKLNKYISKLWFTYKTANNCRIYGENIFLFNNNVLITVYRVPNELIKYITI